MTDDADTEEIAVTRELLKRDPAEVIRRHKGRALQLAEKAREDGDPELAEAIEARVRMVEEGQL